MKSTAMIVVDVAGWIVAAAGAITIALQFVGTPSRTVSVVQALTPWMMLPLVVVAIVAAWTDRVPLGLASALVGLTLFAIGLPLVLTGRGPAPIGDERIVVMTANVLYSNDRIDEVADVIGRVDPDVVAMNEITPEIEATFRSHPIADRYPFRRDEPADLAAGLSVWSKYPLGPAAGIDGLRRGIDTTAETPIGTIRVVAVHPPPPVYDLTTWNAELDALPAITARSDLPTVVLGDFNASWYHPPFRDGVADAGLRDAAAADGRGLAMTWPIDRTMVPPFVALDHVLVDGSVAVVDTRTVRLPGSDHAGVVAILAASG